MVFGVRPSDVVCGDELCEGFLHTGSCEKCEELKYTTIMYVQVQYPRCSEKSRTGKAVRWLKKLLFSESGDRLPAVDIEDYPFLCDF